jgi:hypothetical protein
LEFFLFHVGFRDENSGFDFADCWATD